MAYGDLYTIRHAASVSTAITILQLNADALVPIEILKWWISQRGAVASAQEHIRCLRKTAGATVTAAALGTHVFKNTPGAPDPAFDLGTSETGVIASAEGTDGDVIHDVGFNVLSGYEWVRTHEGELIVPANGFVALKFGTAPAAQNWMFGMLVKELG